MTDEDEKTAALSTNSGDELTEVARRALAEAEERRKVMEDAAAKRPKEINGRNGPDPARYGDWEKKGIAVDF